MWAELFSPLNIHINNSKVEQISTLNTHGVWLQKMDDFAGSSEQDARDQYSDLLALTTAQTPKY